MDALGTNAPSIHSYYDMFKSLGWWKKIGVCLFVLYIIGIIYQVFFESKPKYSSSYIKRAMETETLEHLVKNQPKDIDADSSNEDVSDNDKAGVSDNVKEGMETTNNSGVLTTLSSIYRCVRVDIVDPHIRRLYKYVFG